MAGFPDVVRHVVYDPLRPKERGLTHATAGNRRAYSVTKPVLTNYGDSTHIESLS